MKQQLEKPTKASKANKKPVPQVPVAQRGLGEHVPELAALEESKRVTGQTVRIPLAAIDVPAALRERPLDKERVDQLAMSLRAEGQQIPIVVKTRAQGVYELVDGRHRIEAFKALGWQDISGQIRDDLDDQGVASVRNGVNLVRRVVAPYEEALGYQQMQAAGLTIEQIADRVGVSSSTVKGRLNLAKLPPSIGSHVGKEIALEDVGDYTALAGRPELLKAVEPIAAKGGTSWEIANKLVKDGLVAQVDDNDYKLRYKLQEPYWEKKLAELDHVKVGRSILVTDKKGFQEIAEKARASLVQDRQTKRSEDSYAKQQRRQQLLARAMRDALHAAFAKAVKTVNLDRRFELVLIRAYLDRDGMTYGKEAWFSAVLGLPVKEFEDLFEEDLHKMIDEFNAKKDGGKLLAQFTAAALFSNLVQQEVHTHSDFDTDGGSPLEYAVKTYLGQSLKQFAKKIAKELDDKKAVKAKPSKGAKRAPVKGPAPDPSDESADLDDEDLEEDQ